jgi:hypothetical protein
VVFRVQYVRPGPGDRFDVLCRHRRYSRQSLHKVERHPLRRQQAARVPRQEHHRHLWFDARSIRVLDSHRYGRVQLLEGLARQRQAGDHSRLPRHDIAPCSPVRRYGCRSRDVVPRVVFSQCRRDDCSELSLSQRKMKPVLSHKSVRRASLSASGSFAGIFRCRRWRERRLRRSPADRDHPLDGESRAPAIPRAR